MLMPSAWGMERRKPKFTPEASNIVLFGPGVIEETKANSTKADNKLLDMTIARYPDKGGASLEH
ncbi:hypothetical protein GCM10009086_20380 [Pseudomonas rhodesiae]